MSDILISDIIDKLLKLKAIMSTLDKDKMSDDIVSIDKIIKDISKYNFKLTENTEKTLETKPLEEKSKKGKSTSFNNALILLGENRFDEIKGIKLKYNNFKNYSDVMEYFSKNKKENILKATTILDLKILYYILTNNTEELKGKKDDLFETIINNIKAKKRGAAFNKYV